MHWLFLIEISVAIYLIWSKRVFWNTSSKKLIVFLALLSFSEATFVMYLVLRLSGSIDLEHTEVFKEVIKILGAWQTGVKITTCTLTGDSVELMQLVEQSGTQVNSSVGLVYWVLGEAFALTMPILAVTNIIVLAGSFHKIVKIGFYGLPISIGSVGARKVYVFSCVSKESAQLAGYLAPAKSKNVAVFLRSKVDLLEQADPELYSVIQNVKGILFPGNERQFKNVSKSLWNKIEGFYFISANPDENFLLAEELLDILKTERHKQKEIFVFSEHPSGPRLIDRLRDNLEPDQHERIHLINPSRAMVYYLLSRYPLLIPKAEQNKVLFLGFGDFGSEYLRAALSFTVVNQNKNAIYHIFDREAKQRFSAFKLSAPDAVKRNKFYVEQREVLSESLFNKIQTMALNQEISCVVISLGNDEVNLQAAINLVTILRRIHWEIVANTANKIDGARKEEIEYPVRIFVHIHDHGKKLALNNWCQQQNAWQPKIYVFGSLEDAYKPDVLMPRRMWEKAAELHYDLKAEVNPQDGVTQQASSSNTGTNKAMSLCMSEYERRSSFACVAHLTYYLLDALGAANIEAFYEVPSNECLPEDKCRREHCGRCTLYNYAIANYKNSRHYSDEIETLACQEHQRWMNYVRSEGFQLATDEVRRAYTKALNIHLDKDALLSPCLVHFKDLERLKSKEEVGIDFQRKDRFIIQNIEKYTCGLWSCERDSKQRQC